MTDKHYGNRLLVIPYGGESNLTVVFREHQTGNVLNGTLYYRALAEVDKETTPDEPKASAFLSDASRGVSFSDLLPVINGRVAVD